MIMDREVAKPETYGLLKGWTASRMGMMTLVRVLPPELYDEVQRRVREGICGVSEAWERKRPRLPKREARKRALRSLRFSALSALNRRAD
jgi:hypothetical protein